jgi:hypothetical protein
MTPRKYPLNRSQKFDTKHDDVILGLQHFKLLIEKDFFCEAEIAISKPSIDTIHLILEIKINFDIQQGIKILSDRQIGDLNLNIGNNHDYLHLGQLQKLADKSSKNIDIEEISLVFNDCIFVIHSIFEESITSQLKNIIQNIDKNILYFSKGFTHIPYEIHVPVFEEKPFNSRTDLMDFNIKDANFLDYYSYWALYFDEKIEVAIYDVQHQSIIDGELTMLS